MEQVKIFSPASVANVGCGYDTFGFAIEGIGDIITISKRNDHQLVIQPSEGANLPLDPKENVATVSAQALLDKISSRQGFTFHIKKTFKPGSGLGSSASSAAGAAFGINELLGNPFTLKELLPFVMEGEAFASKSYHADNVAPALFGGFNVVRSYEPLDIFQVPVSKNLKVLVINPDVEVKTSVAKGLIPKELSVPDARKQWGNVAGVVAALFTDDFQLLNESIADIIAEPVRKGLIPGYDDIQNIARTHGSVGFNISGSGPSMFSFFEKEEDIKKTMNKVKDLYEGKGIKVMQHISGINTEGTKVIA